MQQTLVLVKPDGVRKNLIGEIISRFERRGLKVSALKLVKMTEAQAKFHYAEHEGKPFFGELVDFITSGPVAAMVISGENAIKAVRGLMGATNPLESVPGPSAAILHCLSVKTLFTAATAKNPQLAKSTTSSNPKKFTKIKREIVPEGWWQHD